MLSVPIIDHRPWPLPRAPWVMRMTWHDLLFAHWALAPEALRPLVPPPLSLDTFEGRAWLAVAPFHMSDVAPRGIPALPGVSAFPELNVRTYVTCAGAPGVLFFSLDAGSRLAVESARLLYHLPYYHAALSVTPDGAGVRYASRRRDRRGRPGRVPRPLRAGGPRLPAGAGEPRALPGRALLPLRAGAARPPVPGGHPPRALAPPAGVRGDRDQHDGRRRGRQLPAAAPLLHFARRLDVVAWAPHRCMV